MAIRVLVICLCLLLVNFPGSPEVLAGGTPKRFNYIGVDLCLLCHKAEQLGNQYAVWSNTLHSKAFYTLQTPEAEEVAARQGIKNPQCSPECLHCHSTAFAFSKEKMAKDLRVEDGVQCESCHGPGEEYMFTEVMEDLKEAKAKGLIIPTEETCRKCHNPESPT